MTRPLSIWSLLDALLPHRCLLCGTAAQAPLCPGCHADLPRLMGDACPCCATPLTMPAPSCGACLKSPPAFDTTVAALRYAFPVDRLVQALKFSHRLAIADFFAACMRSAAASAALPPENAVIVPIPLSQQRLRERGFNQALEIARPLARHLGLPLDADSLLRVRDTPPQSRLPWRTRQGNLRHAFACRGDFTGKTVIVIDDVMTSGATLDAAARVLKDHGAARVAAWVAARAVKGAPT